MRSNIYLELFYMRPAERLDTGLYFAAAGLVSIAMSRQGT